MDMDEGTRSSILVVLAVVGAFANVFAWSWQRREIKRQYQETEKLTRLTKDLDLRVHRLTTNLDQRIQKLTRVRDLITMLIQTTVIFRQGSSELSAKLNEAVRLAMTLPELEALITEIGDERLANLHSQLQTIVNDELWPLAWNEQPYDFGLADEMIRDQTAFTREMHRRILQLLETATIAEAT